MEEELNINLETEIVDDMPDFEENTAEIPAENAESVDNQSADTENEILNEENEDETDEKTEDAVGSTEKKAETKKESKPKKEFKSNLPTGFSFNPLVIAIKPFYDKLIAEDEIFAEIVKERESREKKPKSLAECADYIMSEAYNYAKSHKQGNFGLAGFPDEEMPQLIRHYYDEEFLEVQKITDAKASFTTSTTPAKTEKKGKEKPVQPKNVLDITKAIVSSTGEKSGKKAKKKDSLSAGFVPMERPDTEKDAKKGSRQQAKSIVQMDMFADFFAE